MAISDPAAIGAAAGAVTAAIATFYKLFKDSKASKVQRSELSDAIELLKAAANVSGGNGNGKAGKSDGIPGYAPECLNRAKEHGERITANETEIRGINSRFTEQDKRFDGLNGKIESFRREVKTEFAELRKEIRESARAS